MQPLDIVLGIVVIAIVSYIVIYNKLISSKVKVIEAWADVDVQLNRRHDLIPGLVNVVKGYAKHEKELLERVTKERAQAIEIDKNDIKKLENIEEALGNDLSALLMVAEAYPNLKANETFLKLQNELTETEDQIASARRIYNSNVNAYNTLLKLFPLNIVAGMHKLKDAAFFEFKESRKVPSAKMG